MRKEIDYTVKDEGRDFGKTFRIKEMSAMQGAKFALKAFSRMVRAGIDVPRDAEQKGLVALAQSGYACLVAMPFELSEELLDELMNCAQFVSSESVVRKIVEQDIEEIQTILTLQKTIYELHVSFFTIGSQSTSALEKSENKSHMLNIKTRR
jgi:hypothetical protein